MPRNFIYLGAGELNDARTLLQRPDVEGVQVVYVWKRLEPRKGVYDFSEIRADLEMTRGLHKKLFIQIQDRFFGRDAKRVPAYLLDDPEYGGGVIAQADNPGEGLPKAVGWAAMEWHPAVRARYQALLRALADEFDGQVYGVNLPETAIDVDPKRAGHGFSCNAYFDAEMDNLAFARKVFKKSFVVQYVNFWPCEWENDHRYMERLFAFAHENGIGLGGPDIIPYRKGQMKNAYPFFNKYKGQLAIVAMAVQEPTLTYRSARTSKPFSQAEFTAFAKDYLGVDIIFWSTSAPWLRRPAAQA